MALRYTHCWLKVPHRVNIKPRTSECIVGVYPLRANWFHFGCTISQYSIGARFLGWIFTLPWTISRRVWRLLQFSWVWPHVRNVLSENSTSGKYYTKDLLNIYLGLLHLLPIGFRCDAHKSQYYQSQVPWLDLYNFPLRHVFGVSIRVSAHVEKRIQWKSILINIKPRITWYIVGPHSLNPNWF